jgi:hypothetical protein
MKSLKLFLKPVNYLSNSVIHAYSSLSSNYSLGIITDAETLESKLPLIDIDDENQIEY